MSRVDAVWKAVIPFVAALGVLIAGEAIFRIVETRLSGNIDHMIHAPAILHQFASGSDGGHSEKILVMGNSLTHNGVDTELLKSEWSAARGGDVEVFRYTPDGTFSWDWYCMTSILRQMENPEIDHVVLGFAWHLLADQRQPEPSRLGGYLCPTSEISALYRFGMRDSAELGEFLMAKGFHLYASRDAVRHGILSRLVPDYEEVTQELLGTTGRDAGKESTEHSGQVLTYRIFRKLIENLKVSGARITLVAMPETNPYTVDPEVLFLANDLGVEFLDYRLLPNITPDSFKDPIHLNRDGAGILTRKLSSDLFSAVHAGPAMSFEGKHALQ